MFAVSSKWKNDSQLCFKCLHCLDSQITVLLQRHISVFVVVHAKNDFYYTHFIWSLSVQVWFQQSKRVLNIDSNGHQKHKNKHVLKQQRNPTQKTCFKHLYFQGWMS